MACQRQRRTVAESPDAGRAQGDEGDEGGEGGEGRRLSALDDEDEDDEEDFAGRRHLSTFCWGRRLSTFGLFCRKAPAPKFKAPPPDPWPMHSMCHPDGKWGCAPEGPSMCEICTIIPKPVGV